MVCEDMDQALCRIGAIWAEAHGKAHYDCPTEGAVIQLRQIPPNSLLHKIAEQTCLTDQPSRKLLLGGTSSSGPLLKGPVGGSPSRL